MIGTELLQLLQGDPLAQMRQQMGGPNPNPQAPPPQQVSAPRSTPPLYPTDPKTGLVVGGPGSGLPSSYERQPNGTYMPPGGVLRTGGPMPQRGIGPGTPMGPMPAMPPGVSPNTIAGPAPQGAPPAPGGPAPPAPPLPQSGPPSVASQSPPDLVQLYGRLMQQQRSGSAIDHGLALMASAYAAPGTQGQIMHSMDNQQPDASSMMNNLVQLQQMQNLTNARPAMIAALGGGDASSGGGTGIPPAVLNGMTNDQLVKLTEQRAQSSLAVSQAAQEGQAKDVEEFKNQGIQDFSAANQKLMDSQAGVDQLLKNMPATMKALADPGLLTTSKWAAWNPLGPSEEVKQQAIAIQKLEAGLTSESLSNVKNVRNKLEFNTLGEALTAGLNANNGPQGVQDALNAIKQKMAVAHAQVYATAGKQIPNQYAGLADSAYTSPTLNGKPNPYYTGATYEPAPQGGGGQPSGQQGAGAQPATISGPSDIAKLPHGQPFIIPSGPNQGKIGYAQ